LKPTRSAYVPGLVFGVLGVPFAAWGLWVGAQRLSILLHWPEVPAFVSDSRVETRGSKHAARIRVRFETPDGVVETEADHDYRYSGHASAAEAVERFAKGTRVSVRQDPDDAKKVRLEADFNFATFGMSLLLLVAASSFFGIALLALRSGRLQVAADAAATQDAKEAVKRRDVRLMARFVLAIAIVFVVAGLALLPGALAQRRWPHVTATIDRADVYARSDSSTRKGRSTTHYVVRLFLAYQHEGRQYLAPMDESSRRSEKEAERIAANIPRGAHRTIRVDPRRPNRIDRIDSWPLALPVIFVGVGLLLSWIVRLLLRRYAR
jgi:hypothetical protein